MSKNGPKSATKIDGKLGLRIKKARLEMGMSQNVLASHLGVSFQQVQKYERGSSRISVSRLVDIAGALQKSTSEFLNGLEA